MTKLDNPILGHHYHYGRAPTTIAMNISTGPTRTTAPTEAESSTRGSTLGLFTKIAFLSLRPASGTHNSERIKKASRKRVQFDEQHIQYYPDAHRSSRRQCRTTWLSRKELKQLKQQLVQDAQDAWNIELASRTNDSFARIMIREYKRCCKKKSRTEPCSSDFIKLLHRYNEGRTICRVGLEARIVPPIRRNRRKEHAQSVVNASRKGLRGPALRSVAKKSPGHRPNSRMASLIGNAVASSLRE